MSNEVNFSHYEVETSDDGSDFNKLGAVPATNNTRYSFLHRNPVTGINYYRLKLVDIDGHFSYSRTVSCLSGELTYAARILKNPFVQNLQLRIEVKEEMPMQLRLADQTGRLLLQKTIHLAKGSNTITLPETNRFSNGVYLIAMNGEGFSQTIKVFKMK